MRLTTEASSGQPVAAGPSNRPHGPAIKNARPWPSWASSAAMAAAVAILSGCQGLSYYSQAIKGQYQILSHRQDIKELLANPSTPDNLKTRLGLLQEMRAFAGKDLLLPVDGHYQTYVDLHRSAAVWNVEAAPEFSMEPKTWWYPVVGRQAYRGYFAERAAQDYGEMLKRKHYDVSVGGAEAYSTLGWFKDPVLNTFIFNPEADLAEVLFHELGHQRVFARGDMDFNEAFATTVGQEGARRWLHAKRSPEVLKAYLNELEHTRQFAQLVKETRLKLEALYGDQRDKEGIVRAAKERPPIPEAQLRQDKARVFTEMKQRYETLKTSWGAGGDFDPWFAHGPNNARLNSVAAYYDLVPGFERVLDLSGGDLEQFYIAVEKLAKLPKEDRHRQLADLAGDIRKMNSVPSVAGN
jgi:predicted aminopeptidase